MSRDARINVGSVVQVDPTNGGVFGGCFLTVTEIATWGVVGDVAVPGRGVATYRAEFDRVRYIGEAVWRS